MVTLSNPSPKAHETPRGKIPKLYGFPFDTMPKGQSFFVGMDEVSSIAVMRTLACRYGKQLGRKFKVVAHHDEQGTLVQIEVFYQADRDEKATPTSKAATVGKAGVTLDATGDIAGRMRGPVTF